MPGSVKPPLIVGCDPSSKHLALYAIQGLTDTVIFQSERLGPNKSSNYHVSNLYEARLQAEAFLALLRPMGRGCDKWLVIEYPVVGRGKARATLVQTLVQGVVQERFYAAGYSIHWVYPATWKSFLGVRNRSRRATTNHGKGPKPAIVQAMKARFPKDAVTCATDPDLLDAAAIARWGLMAYARGNILVA